MLKKIWNTVKSFFEPFANAMSDIVNFILLSAVYFIGIGPVSLFAKLFGRHFLDLKKQNKMSNWHVHKLTKQAFVKYYGSF